MALESILVKATRLRKYFWKLPWIHEEECGKGMREKCISMEESWFLGTIRARVEGNVAHKVEPATKSSEFVEVVFIFAAFAAFHTGLVRPQECQKVVHEPCKSEHATFIAAEV